MTRARRWLQRARALLPQESRVLFIALGIVLGLWIFFVVASAMMAGRTQAFDERMLVECLRATGGHGARDQVEDPDAEHDPERDDEDAALLR